MLYSTLAFIGQTEIIVIVVVAVLIFGVTKIPQLGSAIGQGILNFKRGMREVAAEDEKAEKEKAEKENNSGYNTNNSTAAKS